MADGYTTRPLSPIRKIIAARMTEAKQSIPHFRLLAEIDVGQLLEIRKRLCEGHPSESLSINDLLVKACAAALMDVPAINVQWCEGQIRQYDTADISVVTALQDGLATPIVRDASSKSVWEIAREIRELIARANRNALRMDEILGGSFSISNLGMYGVDQFDAIINPPQAMIMAIGAGEKRPYVVDDCLQIATVMTATGSFDHRAIDGADGAQLMKVFKELCEKPLGLVA